MPNRLRPIFILSGAFLFWLSTCSTQSPPSTSRDWALIIRDLQMITVSSMPDSLKQTEVKKVFESYQITLEDYQKFYSKMTEKDPQSSLPILKEVEKLFTEDMKTEANIQRKKADEKRKID